MATYMNVNTVMYKAPGFCSPLCNLYFCRHCLKLRSSGCVTHEVDSMYCPNCLETMPSGEAKLKKNRCTVCYDCPSCLHTLSVRATSSSVPAVTDSDVTGTPPSGGWPELESIHDKRIATLTTYYRQLAQREKLDKEKKKYSRRKSYMVLTSGDSPQSPMNVEKYGLGAVASRRRSGAIGSAIRDVDKLKIDDIEPSIASVTVTDELTMDMLTQPLNLERVTKIGQRLAFPEQQPKSTDQLYPRHKHNLIKQSLRCKECEHNLCKPEFSPSSIKFKIQLVALHHVPELRISKLPKLLLNQATPVVLTLSNPLDFLTHVTLLPNDPETDDWSTAQVELPHCELSLSRCDDTAEFDDSMDSQQLFDDDPSVVVFRKANKIGFVITVTPVRPESDVKVSFRMKHDYRNIASSVAVGELATSGGSNDNIVWLEHQICLNLGHIS